MTRIARCLSGCGLTLLLAAPALILLAPMPALYAQAQSPGEQLAAASALFDQGKYADAAKLLDSFLAANPKHPRVGAAALALGRCRSEMGQYAKAVPAYEKALAASDPAVAVTANLGLGEAALQTGQWAKAAKALGTATEAGVTLAQAPIALSWLGQADYQLGRYAGAEAAYKEVLEKYPSTDSASDAYFGAGLAALKLGNADAARPFLQTIVDRFPTSENRPQALLLLGQMDFEAKDYASARDTFTSALAIAGIDADTRQASREGLVNSLLKMGDNAGASARLRDILAALPPADPQRFGTELTLGRSLYGQKDYAPAEAAYKEAAKSPDAKIAAQGLYWAANAALAQGHSAEAAAQFAALASRYPASEFAAKARSKAADLHADAQADRFDQTLHQAQLSLDGKQYADAAHSLTALLTAAPAPPAATSAEARYLLGLADQGLGKLAPAQTALSAAVQAAPAADWAADAQVQMAWLDLELKQPARAEIAARAALALSLSKSSPAAEQQARLALTQADMDQQKWDDALTVSQAVLASNPSSEVTATVLFTEAWVSEKQNKADAAQPLWQRLATDFPQSSYAPIALRHLGDAAFQAKHFDAAQAHYADLVAKYPASPDAPPARLGLGNSLYNLSQYDAAASAFDALAADKNAGDLKPEALYWAGASWEKAGKKPEAVQRLTRLVSEYPNSGRVANAKVRLAYLKAGG